MEITARGPERPAATVAGLRVRGREVVDVLAYIVLMFVTALAIGVVLAGTVLLLALPARAADAADLMPMRAGEARQGTLLFRDREGHTFAVPLLHTDVRIHVSGPLLHARVTQSFRNPEDRWFEGLYVFPLPEDAAVSAVRMKIGERVVEAEVQERSRAQATYVQARESGRRAALVEQERPNIFTTSVANIGPREEITVELEYRQQLDYRLEGGVGRFRLRFPMVVGPRYIPGAPAVDEELGTVVAGAPVPDAARISPPVAVPGERLLNPVSLRINLDAGLPIDRIESPYHAVQILRVGETRRQVLLSEGNTPANRDFELTWTLQPGREPGATLFFEPGPGGTTHALLMLVPPAPLTGTELLSREVVFVIDTSGSMEGESIVQAREALGLALGRLQPGDRFNIVAFNSTATALFPAAEPASPGNLGFARRWVAGLRANGGTEMAAALKLALPGDDGDTRVRQVVFLTDGAVGNEAELFALIERRLGRSRLFTVGIGSAPNSFFMRKAAQFGRGSFTYIGQVSEVKDKMGALFARLESPVVRDVRVDWPAGSQPDAWPARVPDLYLGEPIVIAARLASGDGEIRIRGDAGGEAWEQRVALADAHLGSGVGSLWARRRIDALMDRLAGGEDEHLIRAEVIPLAIDYRLASRYTSFVAVDRTPARPAGDALTSARLPTHLPHGWDYAAVFGELPRGASDARWHLLLGTLALGAALALAILSRRAGRAAI